MVQTIYQHLILPGLLGGFYALAPFAPKIRAGLEGRKGLLDRVREFRQRQSGDLLLFHCASAGEFEALKPLAARFENSGFQLAVSYFSPSARKPAAGFAGFHFSDFSPVDSVREVAEYLDVLAPRLIAITKHDVWPNLVWQARDREIPTFLVNGNFHPGSMKRWPLSRGFHRTIYAALSGILTVSAEDAERARRIAGDAVKVIVAGDSRFDRVLERARQPVSLPASVTDPCRDRMVLVAGSTHDRDERLLFAVFRDLRHAFPDLMLMVVPHDPSAQAALRVNRTAANLGLVVRNIDAPAARDESILLVNQTGMLVDLYRLGRIAYVGGAFGKGVHSILEPMAAGLPVLSGPHIGVSHEARISRNSGILRVITNADQLTAVLSQWLSNRNGLEALRRDAREFVEQNCGAADRIADFLSGAIRVAAPR
ncbi:hypothetical protein HZB60_12105 [candidate division KSB1 bacterium]|nr:hypothetical protein [candidate division KSB1 bacterium]